jgi:hypothetical protein
MARQLIEGSLRTVRSRTRKLDVTSKFVCRLRSRLLLIDQTRHHFSSKSEQEIIVHSLARMLYKRTIATVYWSDDDQWYKRTVASKLKNNRVLIKYTVQFTLYDDER